MIIRTVSSLFMLRYVQSLHSWIFLAINMLYSVLHTYAPYMGGAYITMYTMHYTQWLLLFLWGCNYTVNIMSYILLLVKKVVGIICCLLCVPWSVVLSHQLIGVTCIILDFVECITGGNMDLYIKVNHILYYHMDAFRSTVLGHTYFIIPDYLVVKVWVRATLLSLANTILAEPNVY